MLPEGSLPGGSLPGGSLAGGSLAGGSIAGGSIAGDGFVGLPVLLTPALSLGPRCAHGNLRMRVISRPGGKGCQVGSAESLLSDPWLPNPPASPGAQPRRL